MFFPKTALNHALNVFGNEPNFYLYGIDLNRPTLIVHGFQQALCVFEGVSASACWRLVIPVDGNSFVTDILFTGGLSNRQLLPFTAISAHEQRHDTFFREDVWVMGNYDASQDTDNDSYRDAWEISVDCLVDPADPRPLCNSSMNQAQAKDAESTYCTNNANFVLQDYADPGRNAGGAGAEAPQNCPSNEFPLPQP